MKKKTTTQTTSVRLTGLEDQITAYLAANGGTTSKLIRTSIKHFFEHQPSVESVNKLTDSLEKARADFSRVGSNLNQLAHFFNMHDHVETKDLAQAHAQLRKEFRVFSSLLHEVLNVVRGR